MAATLMPETDPETILELEETGETDKLRELANENLEETEIDEEYDVGYRLKEKKTSQHSGTYFESHEISPYFQGSNPDIHVPIESDVKEFYASPDGEFRLENDDGEERTYKLVMSCDEGILLKGEIGFEDREVTDFRYTRGEDVNSLEVYFNGNWRSYGNATEIGEGNETMKQIELIESVYKQLHEENTGSDQEWMTAYSSGMQKDFNEFPEYIESTVESKSREIEKNLDLGVELEELLSTMSHPWKPLLEMRLGSDHRAIFIAGSNLPDKELPERLQGERKILGLGVESKKEFKQKFRSDGDNQVKSASSYAFESIENN